MLGQSFVTNIKIPSGTKIQLKQEIEYTSNNWVIIFSIWVVITTLEFLKHTGSGPFSLDLNDVTKIHMHNLHRNIKLLRQDKNSVSNLYNS